MRRSDAVRRSKVYLPAHRAFLRRPFAQPSDPIDAAVLCRSFGREEERAQLVDKFRQQRLVDRSEKVAQSGRAVLIVKDCEVGLKDASLDSRVALDRRGLSCRGEDRRRQTVRGGKLRQRQVLDEDGFDECARADHQLRIQLVYEQRDFAAQESVTDVL